MFRLIGYLLSSFVSAIGCVVLIIVGFVIVPTIWQDGWGWWIAGMMVVLGGWEYLKHKLGINGGDDGSNGV